MLTVVSVICIYSYGSYAWFVNDNVSVFKAFQTFLLLVVVVLLFYVHRTEHNTALFLSEYHKQHKEMNTDRIIIYINM